MGPGVVRACPKLTTAFRVRTPSGKILDGVLGPALLQPTASLVSLLGLSSSVYLYQCLPPMSPFLPAAVLLGSKFDFWKGVRSCRCHCHVFGWLLDPSLPNSTTRKCG